MPSGGSLQAYDRVVLPPVLVSGTSIGPDAVLSTGHPDLEVREGVITSRSAGTVQAAISVAGAVMTDVQDVRRIRTLADPHLFHTPTGYGVVATACLPDGTPEPYVLIFTTPDLVHYEELGPVDLAAVDLGTVDLGAGGRVFRPRAVYDGARDEYVLWWTDGAGERMFTTMKTLARRRAAARPVRGTARAGPRTARSAQAAGPPPACRWTRRRQAGGGPAGPQGRRQPAPTGPGAPRQLPRHDVLRGRRTRLRRLVPALHHGWSAPHG
ncbi:hypothetical protein [Nonomuraea helvata]|uniref:Glycosyl hydrolase family 32 N-terminal domain-containing protein n=1 Tax=Nonomuraea helvata TaxID=37484 RepID=A0ABV5SC13_9ACTN